MTGYIIWDVSPFVIGEFEYLRWYSLFWAIGIIAGIQLMLKIYRNEDLPLEEIDRLALYVMIGAVVGARLGHILFYDPIRYLNDPMAILPFRLYPSFEFTGFLGLASHGGVIGGLLALLLFCRRYKKNYLVLLDRLVIAGAALGGFIRIGNLFNSEIIGKATDVPWAFIFTKVDQISRHPAQLYESFSYFTICLVLFFMRRSLRIRNRKGLLFGTGFTLIFVQRFFVEFIKENQVTVEEQLPLNIGQFLSVPMVVIGLSIILIAMVRRNSYETTTK